MPKKHTFMVLDALRGVGALLVMQTHFARFFGFGSAPHAAWAVDFFSMLSGFVLTYAYQERIENGWSSGGFVKTRLIRVYPIYLLGLLFGAVFAILQGHFGKVSLSPKTFAELLALGLILIPSILRAQSVLFPFDGPAWTLFHELIVNFIHLHLIRRRNWIALAVLLVIAGTVMQFAIVRHGSSNFGIYRSDAIAGFCRILFSYGVGVLLMFFWREKDISLRVSPIVPLALFLGLLMVPTSPHFASRYDLLVMLCVLPLVIVLSASAQMPRLLLRPAQLLGNASYSIYLLHAPLSEAFEQIWKHLTRRPIEQAAPWSGLLAVVFVVAISMLVDKLYDAPVRTWLREITSSTGKRRMPSLELGAVPTATTMQ